MTHRLPSPQIRLLVGPALETLDRLIGLGQQFDFAFIDADKTNYPAYFEQCLQLVRPGGIIAIDNVLWDGKVIDSSDQSADTVAIRAINRKIHDDSRVEVSMVPIGDGLTLALKL